MIGCSAGLADTASGYPADQFRIRNINIHGSSQFDAQFLKNAIQSNSLFLSTGESIQNESFGAIRLGLTVP
jgi:hypothetical protein